MAQWKHNYFRNQLLGFDSQHFRIFSEGKIVSVAVVNQRRCIFSEDRIVDVDQGHCLEVSDRGFKC